MKVKRELPDEGGVPVLNMLYNFSLSVFFSVPVLHRIDLRYILLTPPKAYFRYSAEPDMS